MLRLSTLLCFFLGLAFAQSKPAVPVTEFGKWESIAFQAPSVSADGKWFAYGVRREIGNHELRMAALAGGKNHTAAFGEQPAFSADSMWLAYLIGMHEDQEEKLRKDKKPVRRKLGLVNLASNETNVFADIESFSFSRRGAFLAMRQYPPEKPAAPPPAEGEPPPEPAGANLIVRNLVSGVDHSFGSVIEYAWQDEGTLLAMTVGTESKSGNGVQLFDSGNGVTRALDSEPAIYTGLRWRKNSADLAVLRTRAQDGYEDETCIVLAWKDATQPFRFDQAADWRIVRHRAPVWSEDGSVIFVGVAPWVKKPPPLTKEGDTEPSGVEVWHSLDLRVIPEQKLRATRDRQRSSLAAWHINSSKFVRLSENPEEEVRPLKDSRAAILLDGVPHERGAMFGRPYWDVHRINVTSGEKTKLLERVEFAPNAQSGKTGRYLLYLKANHYWAADLSTGEQRNLTAAVTTSFVDLENDHTGPHKPPFGVAGWTKDDRSVIVYDQYDLWELFPSGAAAKRLTNGASEHIRHRYIQLDPKEEFLDPGKGLYLGLAGRWSKRSGFARLTASGVERMLWEDKQVSRLVKAKDTDVFLYLSQAFDDSPDFFIAGADLKNARQVSETNPFQSQYAWGRAELIDYQSPQGKRLQGALLYPARYESGKKYPMVVYFYEIMSTNLHSYTPLSERIAYSPSVFTNLDYFVLMPDISFRPRDPGRSIVECLTAAVNKVLDKGHVDAKRIGLVGHSWGGYGAAFTSTQSSMFAAAVAGAPLTNLSSSYGEIYWNNGIPETGHVEVGQERMQVPLYEDPQAYLRNSATFFAHQMRAPLLLAHGDKDGACDWHQSIEMYNLARRAGKHLVLLVYPGENHSLRTKPNQLDYQRRIREWFGHYLKGEPAPDWIVKGVPHLERQKELQRLKEAKPKQAALPATSGE